MKKILFRMFCIIAVAAASCTEDNPVAFNSLAPELISFNPKTAYIGDTITITAKNFPPAPKENLIYFQGGAYTWALNSGSTRGDTSIFMCRVPLNSESGRITIKTNEGSNSSIDNLIILNYLNIDSIRPLKVRANDLFTVYGSGFTKQGGGVLDAYFDSTKLEIVSMTENQITVKAPGVGFKYGKYKLTLKNGIVSESGKDDITLTSQFASGKITISGIKAIFHFYEQSKMDVGHEDSISIVDRMDTVNFSFNLDLRNEFNYPFGTYPCSTCAVSPLLNDINFCRDYRNISSQDGHNGITCTLVITGIDIDTNVNIIKNIVYSYKYLLNTDYLSQSSYENEINSYNLTQIPFTKNSDGSIIAEIKGDFITANVNSWSQRYDKRYTAGIFGYNIRKDFVKFIQPEPNAYIRLVLNP